MNIINETHIFKNGTYIILQKIIFLISKISPLFWEYYLFVLGVTYGNAQGLLQVLHSAITTGCSW